LTDSQLSILSILGEIIDTAVNMAGGTEHDKPTSSKLPTPTASAKKRAVEERAKRKAEAEKLAAEEAKLAAENEEKLRADLLQKKQEREQLAREQAEKKRCKKAELDALLKEQEEAQMLVKFGKNTSLN
jgi:phage terminase Nu1 subunit (DNA packaging protein)